jgi:ubiquinone/menaquinone biosynthesis C-methylase UbiE
MARDETPAARSQFYARIGATGWRQSGYDTFTYDSPGFRRWIAAQLPAKSCRILSIGCGAGELERELVALGHAVIGLDLSPAMLERAARKGLQHLIAADARQLPLDAATIDIVLIMESIGYLALDAVFAEVRRVLKKRGQLLVTTYGAKVDAHRRYYKWKMDEVAGLLGEAGFRIGEKRPLAVTKTGVRDAVSEEKAGLLYLAARPRP